MPTTNPRATIASSPPTPLARLTSIDAYRGLVMLLMMAEVLELRSVASALGDKSALWNFLAYHQSHVEWAGCSLHDLIQPSFSFLVGVALPFSISARQAKGESFRWMTWHAAWRAAILSLLGIFLRSTGRPQTNFTFEDTLTQIGLGYLPLFFLGFLRQRWAVVTCIVLLVGYWGAFALYPAPHANFDYEAVGVPSAWEHNYAGFAAHWNKNSNAAWAFDKWFMNLLPRESPFTHNRGGYSTLSFIPTLATMILGLVAGQWLRGNLSPWRKVGLLVLAGAVTMALGLAADWTGVCPIVKRIWTPSWVLYSGGWCYFILAGFYSVCDIINPRLWEIPLSAMGPKSIFALLIARGWSFPLRVIGANSIFAYLLAHVGHAYVVSALHTHVGESRFHYWGAYEPFVTGLAVLFVWWLLLWWMYRQRLFVKI